MSHLINVARVAPSTVDRYSRGDLPSLRAPRRTRTRTLTVTYSEVTVDPRIMAALRSAGVDFRYVEVRSATEVVIRNQRVR